MRQQEADHPVRAFSLPRSIYGLKHRDYIRLKTWGAVIRNPFMTVVFSPGENASPRLGLTVGKRVGNACERNRIKRLLREYFRLNRHLLERIGDINIIVKQEAAGKDHVRLDSALNMVFHQLSERASTGF